MRANRGFTLIELVVVVLIVGVLIMVAAPQYARVMENSKAEDAYTLVQTIGASHRMLRLDKGNAALTTGTLNACDNTLPCPAAAPYPACALMQCNYMAKSDLSFKPYDFYACGDGTDCCGLGAGGVNIAACAKRKPSAGGTYATWGYTISFDGKVESWSTDPNSKPPIPSS